MEVAVMGSSAATVGVLDVRTLKNSGWGVWHLQNVGLPCELKFVVCKPLQYHCHHSPEPYFSPQKTPKAFGSRALHGPNGRAHSAPRTGLRGGAPRKGKEGSGENKWNEGGVKEGWEIQRGTEGGRDGR